jgi:post-segregation antitoxin (ccd killing protein)
MPRMQVYLPDDLYDLVKARDLPASELLQRAVRAEVRRLDLLAETDKYLRELIKDVGAPSVKERERAAGHARRLERRPARKTG